MAASPKLYEYLVVGAHAFPIDMLRYDHAWPRSQEDASKIVRHEPLGTLSVWVVSHSMPTAERWHSFGYRIESLHIDNKQVDPVTRRPVRAW